MLQTQSQEKMWETREKIMKKWGLGTRVKKREDLAE